jgi:hypothetical protein
MGYRAGARLERTLTTIGIDHDVKVYRHLRSWRLSLFPALAGRSAAPVHHLRTLESWGGQPQ